MSEHMIEPRRFESELAWRESVNEEKARMGCRPEPGLIAPELDLAAAAEGLVSVCERILERDTLAASRDRLRAMVERVQAALAEANHDH